MATWLSLRARFLLLRAVRWLPIGLQIPVMVLYVLDQGLTITQYGAAVAVQAAVVFLLELPTGGLADVVGARTVLLVANTAGVAFVGLLILADTFPVLVLAWAVQGIYRALESGPLEAWYINTALAAGEVDVSADLAKAASVIALAIGLGGLAGSGLVLLAPSLGVEPLLLPLLVVLGIRIVELGAIAVLLSEPSTGRHGSQTLATGMAGPLDGGPQPGRAERLTGVAGQVVATIANAVRVVGRTRVVAALLIGELLWGMGFVGVESLYAPRLAEVVGDPVRAATWLGPISSVAWLGAAVASGAVPRLSRRLGPALAALALRAVMGLVIVSMGLLVAPLALAAAYLLTLMSHVSSGAVHGAIFHEAIPSPERTTLLSARSMAGYVGGGIGYATLGWLAGWAGPGPALVVAGLVVLAGAPFYLAARSSTGVMSTA